MLNYFRIFNENHRILLNFKIIFYSDFDLFYKKNYLSFFTPLRILSTRHVSYVIEHFKMNPQISFTQAFTFTGLLLIFNIQRSVQKSIISWKGKPLGTKHDHEYDWIPTQMFCIYCYLLVLTTLHISHITIGYVWILYKLCLGVLEFHPF